MEPKSLFEEYGLEGALEIRALDLKEWLLKTAPAIPDEQRHLDRGTGERSYWHYAGTYPRLRIYLGI